MCLSLPPKRHAVSTAEVDVQCALVTKAVPVVAEPVVASQPIVVSQAIVATTELDNSPQSKTRVVSAPPSLKQLASQAAIQQLAEVYQALDEREVALHYVNFENVRVKKQLEAQNAQLNDLRAKNQSLAAELFQLKSNYSILQAEQADADGENEFLRHEREVHQQFGRTPKSAVRRLLLPMRPAGAENAPQSPLLQPRHSIAKLTPSALRRSIVAARSDAYDNAPQSPQLFSSKKLARPTLLLNSVPEEPSTGPETISQTAASASASVSDTSINENITARLTEYYSKGFYFITLYTLQSTYFF